MAAGAQIVPPPRLEHFVVTEKLGQGTYATVYKAYRKGDKRDVVAVKCVKRSSLSKKSSENLLSEIELLKRLEHEHIVQLKDFQWDNQNIFLIMEYCSGGDLSEFIQSHKRLPELVARKFLRQLALAVEYLWKKNIAHMDLKPQNLLLSSTYEPVLKLGDFGFAQHLSKEADMENLRGSPLYMAPEMICSETYDSSVDLWSVGVILYEALFGMAPFASHTFAELEKKIKSTEPVKLPTNCNVSKDCKDLLLALLQRDPKQRLSFEEFFSHPFIDLEHAPSPQCFPKAIQLVTQAVKEDEIQEFKKATQLYCKALDYFVPAIEYEKDSIKREAIRQKTRQYMLRAESLKEYLKCKSGRLQYADKISPDLLLAQYSKNYPRLKTALEQAEMAEIKDEHGHFVGALDQYQVAIGQLLPILAETPKGKYKDAAHSEIERYMKRAEEIKMFLKLSDEQCEPPTVEQEARCCIQ